MHVQVLDAPAASARTWRPLAHRMHFPYITAFSALCTLFVHVGSCLIVSRSAQEDKVIPARNWSSFLNPDNVASSPLYDLPINVELMTLQVTRTIAIV